MSDEPVDVMDNELCAMCGRNKTWHRENDVKHVFTTEEGDLREAAPTKPPKDAPKPRAAVVVPSDPVLRFILIDKGIITPEELTDAETKLKAAGALVTSGPNSE